MDDTTQQDPLLKFMDGTSSVHSYAVLARRGSIALGLKLQGVVPGEMMGMPGKSFLAFRLRSAHAGSLFDAEDAEQNVTAIANHKLELHEAWPSFEFEKINPERASMAAGVFVRGSLKDDPLKVFDRILEQDLIEKTVSWVCEQAGPDYVWGVPRRVMVHFRGEIEKLRGQVFEQVEIKKAFELEVEGAIEQPMAHAALLKKIYEAKQQSKLDEASKIGDAETGFGDLDC